jgi:hypothetical protein
MELFLGWKKALEDVHVQLGILESKLKEKMEQFEALKRVFHLEDEVFHYDATSKRTKNSILLTPRFYNSRDLISIQFEIKCTHETLGLLEKMSNVLFSHYELKNYDSHSNDICAIVGESVGEFGF